MSFSHPDIVKRPFTEIAYGNRAYFKRMMLMERNRHHSIEAEVCREPIYMLIEIPPKLSASSVMGYLKGKSSSAIYERWGNEKFR